MSIAWLLLEIMCVNPILTYTIYYNPSSRIQKGITGYQLPLELFPKMIKSDTTSQIIQTNIYGLLSLERLE